MKDAGVVVHEDSPEALHNQFDAVNKELDKFRDLCARNKSSKFLKEAIQVLAKHCESLRSLEVNHSSENDRSPSGDSSSLEVVAISTADTGEGMLTSPGKTTLDTASISDTDPSTVPSAAAPSKSLSSPARVAVPPRDTAVDKQATGTAKTTSTTTTHSDSMETPATGAVATKSSQFVNIRVPITSAYYNPHAPTYYGYPPDFHQSANTMYPVGERTTSYPVTWADADPAGYYVHEPPAAMYTSQDFARQPTYFCNNVMPAQQQQQQKPQQQQQIHQQVPLGIPHPSTVLMPLPAPYDQSGMYLVHEHNAPMPPLQQFHPAGVDQHTMHAYLHQQQQPPPPPPPPPLSSHNPRQMHYFPPAHAPGGGYPYSANRLAKQDAAQQPHKLSAAAKVFPAPAETETNAAVASSKSDKSSSRKRKKLRERAARMAGLTAEAQDSNSTTGSSCSSTVNSSVASSTQASPDSSAPDLDAALSDSMETDGESPVDGPLRKAANGRVSDDGHVGIVAEQLTAAGVMDVAVSEPTASVVNESCASRSVTDAGAHSASIDDSDASGHAPSVGAAQLEEPATGTGIMAEENRDHDSTVKEECRIDAAPVVPKLVSMSKTSDPSTVLQASDKHSECLSQVSTADLKSELSTSSLVSVPGSDVVPLAVSSPAVVSTACNVTTAASTSTEDGLGGSNPSIEPVTKLSWAQRAAKSTPAVNTCSSIASRTAGVRNASSQPSSITPPLARRPLRIPHEIKSPSRAAAVPRHARPEWVSMSKPVSPVKPVQAQPGKKPIASGSSAIGQLLQQKITKPGQAALKVSVGSGALSNEVDMSAGKWTTVSSSSSRVKGQKQAVGKSAHHQGDDCSATRTAAAASPLLRPSSVKSSGYSSSDSSSDSEASTTSDSRRQEEAAAAVRMSGFRSHSHKSPRGQRDSAKSEDKRQELEEKQKRALERRRQHLENTARKAQDEEKKVEEIAFINTLGAENRRREMHDKNEIELARLSGIKDDKQKKQIEQLAREEAAQERRRQQEEKRVARLDNMHSRKLAAEEKSKQNRLALEKARGETAREKALERERRLAAYESAKKASQEELKQRLDTQQTESMQRRERQLHQRKMSGARLRLNSQEPISCEEFPYMKFCSLCNTKIPTEIFLVSHLQGLRHSERLQLRVQMLKSPLPVDIEEYTHSFITELGDERVDSGQLQLEQEDQAAQKKRLKRDRIKLNRAVLKADPSAVDRRRLSKLKQSRPPNDPVSQFYRKVTHLSDVLSNDQLRVKVQGGASSSGITSSDCGTVPPAVLLELRRSLADVMEKHKCMMATESLQSDTTEKIKVLQEVTEFLTKINFLSSLYQVIQSLARIAINTSFERKAYDGVLFLHHLVSIETAIETAQLMLSTFPSLSSQLIFNENVIALLHTFVESHTKLTRFQDSDDNAEWSAPVTADQRLHLDQSATSFVIRSCFSDRDVLYSLMLLLTSAINAVLVTSLQVGDTQGIRQRQLISSYLMSSGFTKSMEDVFCNSHCHPIASSKGSPIRRLLHCCLRLLLALPLCNVTSQSRDLFSHRPSDTCKEMMNCFASSEAAGLVTFLYTELLANGAPRKASGIPHELSKEQWEFASVVLQTLNLWALVDLNRWQEILGAEGMALQVRHIASFILLCSSGSRPSNVPQSVIMSLLTTLTLFTVGCKANQTVLQFSRSPTILQQLYQIHLKYLSNETYSSILMPVLINMCFENPDNFSILTQAIDGRYLLNFLMSADRLMAEHETKRITFVSDWNNDVGLCTTDLPLTCRLPRHRVSDIKAFFSTLTPHFHSAGISTASGGGDSGDVGCGSPPVSQPPSSKRKKKKKKTRRVDTCDPQAPGGDQKASNTETLIQVELTKPEDGTADMGLDTSLGNVGGATSTAIGELQVLSSPHDGGNPPTCPVPGSPRDLCNLSHLDSEELSQGLYNEIMQRLQSSK